MNTKTKKKLCWNCEGEVLLTVTNCPFCGVNVEAVEDPLTPPYKPTENAEIPPSPYTPKAPQPQEEEEEAAETDPKNLLLSLAFLLVGAAFAIFGLVLWLFADQTGHLTLRWNGHYWYVYLLISLPLLFLGWKATREK